MDETWIDTFCSLCALNFTSQEEYDGRHSSTIFSGEEYHSECCPECKYVPMILDQGSIMGIAFPNDIDGLDEELAFFIIAYATFRNKFVEAIRTYSPQPKDEFGIDGLDTCSNGMLLDMFDNMMQQGKSEVEIL